MHKFTHKFMLAGLISVVCCLPVAMADDNKVGSDTAHAEGYVKDSIITAKVKSKLAEKHMSTLTDIKVNTDSRGAVWLSGRAPSQDASDLAAMIAKDTDGVTSVHNKIAVVQ